LSLVPLPNKIIKERRIVFIDYILLVLVNLLPLFSLPFRVVFS
jgi:hypothetical protein